MSNSEMQRPYPEKHSQQNEETSANQAPITEGQERAAYEQALSEGLIRRILKWTKVPKEIWEGLTPAQQEHWRERRDNAAKSQNKSAAKTYPGKSK